MATTVYLGLDPSGYSPPAAGDVRLVLGPDAGFVGKLVAAAFTPGPSGLAPTAHAAPVRTAWGEVVLSPLTVQPRTPWGGLVLTPLALSVRAPWGSPPPVFGAPARTPWGAAAGRSTSATTGWTAPWPRFAATGSGWSAARGVSRAWGATWAEALLETGPGPWQAPTPAAAPRPGVLDRLHLHFCAPLRADRLTLRLGVVDCPDKAVVTRTLPARSTYMLTHAIQAVRLPDLTPIELFSASLSTDDGAYGWSLSAEGPTSLLQTLAPDTDGTPAQMRLTIDGLVWELMVSGLRRQRSFSGSTAQITAGSVTGVLADPYAPALYFSNPVPMTAAQLAAHVLEGTGVGLDWRVTDWLIPATTWSATVTPLQAVRQIADAIGATLASPRVGSSLIVAPRYPVLPWAWSSATPDVVLASLDPVITEGYERSDRPSYDGVYVSGQAQGVLALVKRTGSGPALTMPLVTDALITALDAARQRGEALLGAAGPRATMTLALPVLTGAGEPGVVDVGSLIHVPDPSGAWRGLVRGVNVDIVEASITQTLTVERHL